jgi:glycosyltransferase involved in cell wall biosynthesis
MRIAVLNITGSGISGGYKRYLQNILPLLAKDTRVSAVLCASPESFRIEEWAAHHEKLRFTGCRPFRFLRHSPDPGLRDALRVFAPDVIFIPVSRYMRFGKVPVVTMIQNMAPLVPGASWHGLRECASLAAQWLETRLAVKRADRVIVMSDFVRQFLMKSWNVPENKVRLIYFGSSMPASRATRHHTIPAGWNKFLFTAGSIEKYRGLEDVIRCAHHARTVLGRPLKIVIGGSSRKAMMSYHKRLRKLSEDLGVAGDLSWVGQLTSEEMTWCYNNCSAFLMTSRVESFPVIVLEALAHGCQCVAADNPPLPEAFLGAAVYYPPGDHIALAARIFEVLDRTPAELSAMREKVGERNSDFSWHKATDATIGALLEAVSEVKGSAALLSAR